MRTSAISKQRAARVAALQREICGAATRCGVDAPLVAAILDDEMLRYDLSDRCQDFCARLIAAGGDRLGPPLARAYGAITFHPIENQSFGPAQMKLATLRDLLARGYLDSPSHDRQLPALLAILLDHRLAPALIAARLRQTSDHWRTGGVNISNRPEILATLYSIGLEGRNGVHTDPQPSARGLQVAANRQAMREILNRV
jgi:hypothetical protein